MPHGLKWYRFIGTDGSMGYKKGQLYCLQVLYGPKKAVRINYPYPCPYSSMEAFARNWAPAQGE